VIFIVVLLRERDPRVLISHPHVQCRPARADGKRAIAELAGKVKRLPQRLPLRQAQRVLGDLRLDACAHRTRRPEEPVGRGQSFQSLMRTLEVVVLDVERHPPLAVLEVGEHRAREQLLPQRLPEPLDLPAGLRMVRPALHMRDAMTLQLRLELGTPSPGGVLPALVGQDLPRRPIVCDATCERLEHQYASLVMRHRKAHQIPGVIVQEGRDINPFMPPQQEREQVRLPQLVRLGALKVLDLLLAAHPLGRRLRLDALGSQHSPYRRLRRPDPEEPPHHIADAATAGSRRLRMRRQDRLRALIGRLLEVRTQRGPFDCKRLFPALTVRLHPQDRRRVRHA
jgi:hypothetical protein